MGAPIVGTARVPPATRRFGQRPVWLTTTVWSLGVIVSLGAAATAVIVDQGDPEGAARLANTEIDALLGPGERTQVRARVGQRLWWDYFRLTHGVLGATATRAVYVGVPPHALFSIGDEPAEFVTASYEFSRARLARQRVFFGLVPGARVSTAAGSISFSVEPSQWGRIDSINAALAAYQDSVRKATAAEQRATEATAIAARAPIVHLVRRGEAIEFIARRYGIAVDSLLQWNDLTTPRITVGQRLVVRPGVRP